jgi:capsular polysaccharide biosynthesis protein
MTELINFFIGLTLLVPLFFFAWLLDGKKKYEQQNIEEDKQIAPLLGVVSPKKKDVDSNE